MPKALIFVLALCVASCAGSRITDSYASPEPVAHFEQIVVLALVPEKNLELRERLENHMADDLCQAGYYTRSALDVYGKDAFCGLCRQEILEKLHRDHVDAVVTIALVSRNDEKEYIAAKIPRVSSLLFFDYQEKMAAQAEEQGYYAVKTFYYWEANLYSASDQKLLYSARTETVDPSSLDGFAHEYGRLIIKDMVSKGVIRPN